MSDENKTVELKEEDLEKVAGGAKLERVKVEIYCKDCGNVIRSWQETKGLVASVDSVKITDCNNCGSENIGRREIPLQN